MVRMIERDDLNRIILTSLDRHLRTDPRKIEDVRIDSQLRLRIEQETENLIVQSFLGSQSFLTRERVIRLLGSVCEFEGNHRFLDLKKFWGHIAESHLMYDETLYVRLNRFEHWRQHMHAIDEDLPGLIWLLSNNDNISTNNDLQKVLEYWPTFIRGYDPSLYRELEKGIACLHLHLSGSYPAPFYWVGLMNDRFQSNNFKEEQDKIPEYLRGYRNIGDLKRIDEIVVVAKKIRRALFKFAQSVGFANEIGDISENAYKAITSWSESKEGIKETEDRLKNSDCVDYAQSLVGKYQNVVCPSLIGERSLLFLALRALDILPKWKGATLLAQHIWTYLNAKNEFLSFVQQAEGVAGFDYFEHVFRLIKWNIKGQAERCACEIGQFLQESGSVIKLELMIAPPDSEKARDVLKDLEVVTTAIRKTMDIRLSKKLKISYGNVDVGLILHFIKDHGESLAERGENNDHAYKIYHYTRRDKSLSEIDACAPYFTERGSNMSVPLIGIDTANRELYCPPEVFAEAYEKARAKLRYYATSGRRLPIRCTYHVGEDFVFLMTGLRRMFEAIQFLPLKAGDRIGHGSALGFDPEQWLRKSPSAELHLVDQIDDAVFERYLLRVNRTDDIEARTRLEELEQIIETLSLEIFGTEISSSVLERAWLNRGNIRKPKGKSYSDPESIPNWIRLQGRFIEEQQVKGSGAHYLVPDPRSLVNQKNNKENVDFPKNEAERILHEYHYDVRTIRRFLQINSVELSSSLPHLRRVQKILRNFIIERGIIIESNPTSNWLISGVEKHTDTPASQWLRYFPDMPVTINPDDPTVFSTSIENEYFMIFASLIHGSDPLSRTEALHRLSAARSLALNSSFL